MLHTAAGLDLVSILTARSGTTEPADLNIIGINGYLCIFFTGHYRDRDGAGVYTSSFFGRRNPLYPMTAGFVLPSGEIISFHGKNNQSRKIFYATDQSARSLGKPPISF